MPARRGRGPRARGLTDRGRSLAVGGALLAAAGLLLGFPDLTRVGLATLLLAALAGLTSWRHRPHLQVRRTLHPAPLVAGRPGRIELTLHHDGPHGTQALAVAEHVSPWLGSTARLVLPPLRPGQTTTASYDVRPTRRGRHRAGPLTVVTRDPLGITHRSAIVGTGLEVLVLPPVHDLSAGDPTGLGLGHEGDAPANVLAGTEHDASVREYRQGDDLRRVHWGVTAHRGRLMVRHEALPRLRRAVLVLDASAASWGLRPAGRAGRTGAGEGQDGGPGFEWAIEAMASIAAHLSSLDFTLHLVIAGARRDSAPHEDPMRALLLEQVLARLATVEPGEPEERTGTGRTASSGPGSGPRDGFAEDSGVGERSLGSAARDVAGAGGVVVLITGDRSPAAAHETFALLRTGLAGLAMVLDTAAFAADPGAAREPAGGAGRGAGGAREGEGGDAQRLCGYARSGGWRALDVTPATTPAMAWARLLGSPRGLEAERRLPQAASRSGSPA